MQNSHAITLNTCEMQPPQPMELVLQAIDELQTGQYIKMIHRMEPQPLYNILLDNGYRYKVDTSSGLFNIYIWKAVDKLAESHVKINFD